MRSAYATCALLLLAAMASAQSFNIDVDRSGLGAPSAAYAGAAGRPGAWNAIGGAGGGPFPLTGLHQEATSASCVRSGGTAAGYVFDNRATTGELEALMDDAHQDRGPAAYVRYTFRGLEAGAYTVYTYAWSPGDATDASLVTVNGLSPQRVGGASPAGADFVQGVTHAVHQVTIRRGMTIDVQVTAVAGACTVNGFQIVDGFGMSLAQSAPGRRLEITHSHGDPGELYLSLFTPARGTFPQGALFGVDIAPADALAQVQQGAPFFGTLDAQGGAAFVVGARLPPGTTLFCTSVTLDGAYKATSPTRPFAYTVL